jgi:parvulin-like peptidyl-prolyl isomerase
MEQAVSEEVVTRELKSTITISDADVKKFYETNGQAFAQPELARASHILVSTRDSAGGLPLTAEQKQAKKLKAEKLLERVRKGEDFAKVAEEASDDPAVKQNKGEYKFAHAKDDPRRAMVPEFEKVAFSLKPGEISDIVATDYGYHIIKLHEILAPSKTPLAEATPRIRDHLLQTELEKRMTPYFEKLKTEAAVEIMDERLKAALEKVKAEMSKSGDKGQ